MALVTEKIPLYTRRAPISIYRIEIIAVPDLGTTMEGVGIVFLAPTFIKMVAGIITTVALGTIFLPAMFTVAAMGTSTMGFGGTLGDITTIEIAGLCTQENTTPAIDRIVFISSLI